MDMFEPEDSERNEPEGAVALGALVVAGGQAAILLAAVDQAFHAVAQAVEGTVERAAAALGLAAGDRVADAPPSAVGALRSTGVPLVTNHAGGA